MSVPPASNSTSTTAVGLERSATSLAAGRRAAILLLALLAAACGGPSGPSPTPGPVDPLTISCPADQALESPDGQAVVVNYPAPSTAGGSAPVEYSCDPQSGSSFPSGSTDVACKAVDHDQRTAACGFAVRVGGPLQLACPTDQAVKSPDGQPVAVSYPAPTVLGGTAPVEVACTPASDSPFAVGSTTVACTAHDQMQRVAECSFTTTVRGPQLTVTEFVAFGDSITYGTQAPCGSSVTDDFLTSYQRDMPMLWASARAGTAYPAVLGGMLADRYKDQSISVINEGVPGEKVTHSDTTDRLASVLRRYSPDVLLLQEGANDVNDKQIPIDRIASSLATLIRVAKSRGVSNVLIGTLLPERDGSCRAYAPERVEPVNDRIRSIAAREGAELVDLWESFAGQEGTLLGQDGLHPNIAGYEKMAEIFFASIRDHFEVEEPTVTTLRRRFSIRR
jgi:lysophospholipase L1-like esterase